MKNSWIIVVSLLVLSACSSGSEDADASGSFEAVEAVISSEATGTLLQFDINEGQAVQAGQVLGYVDSLQLHLKKQQLLAQMAGLLSQQPNISTQIAALQEQVSSATREKQRVTSLIKAEAATQKQLDDVTTQLELAQRQLLAVKSSLGNTSSSLYQQTTALQFQVEQLNDQLNKCRLVSPQNGTILSKYNEVNELALMGKPLYKIADLSKMTLKAYFTGNQLPILKLNQNVKVYIDGADGNKKEYTGRISWISDQAEFTPKTIQTKDERANQVYAVKVIVENDGQIKVGMYGEVQL